MKKLKTVIFDFNGTIIDDVNLCFDLLNKMLISKNHPPVSKEKYLEVFTFPVIKYYELSGFNFPEDNFEELAKVFVKEYKENSNNCPLYDGLIKTLDFLKSKGIKLVILSASEINMLKNQLKYYNIDHYFSDILGIDNYHAASKEKIALEYQKQHNLVYDETLFIGDTLHDYEVAKAINVQSLLIADGHQSYARLKNSGSPTIHKMNELISYLQKNSLI